MASSERLLLPSLNMSLPSSLPIEGSTSFLNTSTIIALSVFFALLCACIIVGHLLEENKWANASITALLLGLVSGGVVLLVTKGESSKILVFSEDLFFLYLLPPIIFNAGFQVKKKQFFKNFTIILLFGIIGTVISFCLISLGTVDLRYYFLRQCYQMFLLLERIPHRKIASVLGLFISVEDPPTHYLKVLGRIWKFLYDIRANCSNETHGPLCSHDFHLKAREAVGSPCKRQGFGAALFFKKMGFTTLDIQDYLAIGSILSATDSVCTLQVLNQDETPFLYSVVFGEGVVNDATSIVLFNAVQSLNFTDLNATISLKLLGTFLYLFFTSTALGITFGLLSAFIIKTLYFGRHSTDREVALMMLMAYLSYMLAELLDLSGILTVFFCGIVMSHYTWHNVTESSRITTKHAFATISFIAETFIFLYVGMDALDIDKWKESDSSVGTSLAISSTLFALVLVGRAAFVYPIANILNCFQKRESDKLEFKQQFIMWWAGLMRGAVTVALSYSQFSSDDETSTDSLMITTTIIVVLFSTVVFGSVTKPLIEALLLRNAKPMISDATDMPSLEDLRLLFLEKGNDDDQNDEGNSSNQRPAPKASNLRLLMAFPTTTVHYLWRKFDDRFMRPMFGGRGFVPYVPVSPSGAAESSHNS